MSLAQEWESFKTPPVKEVAPVPQVGSPAPAHPNLTFPTDKPTVIVFLRHCGCPFAEKAFKNLTSTSTQYKDVHFIAVSHSSPEATERWVIEVGGNWEVQVVVDYERELYAHWGLGIGTTWQIMGPMSLYKTFRLGKDENIWNRATESGNRWQTSGAFALDQDGMVKYSRVAASSSELPDLEAALTSLGVKVKPKPPPEPRTDGFL
ncbi:putative alkyl hydroperoxide reductase subunit c thiol specific antioxidant protein [Daldinia childiae]|uniref:putative alkyl hydroperoxide reductase subunit c thiol specific antioxidant protein n=1 Tax=Daldinia childiae TaxID=326645 RepID=UPI001447A5B2|nr:putative alkyl hydroperoxide reductase subunit c thiol specific antioxidant protein [Daldinia childiae]KAF3059693.1 putative alkyl hydroperoxide reductase subunit c thiol specific antioxidant protein [Daldinia childiae]